jgi:hypothetical protein
MRRAIVKITKEVLEEFLPLPKGTKIVGIIPDDRRTYRSQTVEFIVEHEDFFELSEGEIMPDVKVEVTDDGCKWY